MRATGDWAEHATAGLADAGYRRGGARAAVVQLLDTQGCALSAAEIETQLAKRGRRTVARATIYRVLEELEQIGMVTRIDLAGGLARYEPARPDDHHHHLVCQDCGDLFPFADSGLERAITRVSKNIDFEVTAHDVVLYGMCSPCRSGSG